ncbi:ATP-dependent sacrificial sulfur transferase LarE [Aminithiophilus ramosus]|uniref:ATP-dependent sacrificial sulfur transferase LarE n=1 Tax=Aminithiophilus ramosus TaxID=3029084 RepID=A0A9Q7AIK9_9BACT|nr:ATP-dependent sacrificial sulfur transferase LarE [Aminithiophilus ramosus]QTX32435.1 ATP-dependent sacrificial sulfur transferase LarE [Aminithiophilus ramosus]
MDSLDGKAHHLETILAAMDHAVVLYSGGVDSSLVAYLARRVIGERAWAVTLLSPLSPPGEVERARAFAAEARLGLAEIAVDETALPEFAANPPHRCYLCRKVRQEVVRRWAAPRGFSLLLDGMNVSDLDDDRPGMRAADEEGVRHPLIEAAFAKADVRDLSRRLGLSGWDRPAQPCLASRFPHRFALDGERLDRVARAEAFLKDLGLEAFRVRHLPYRTAVVAASRPEVLLERRQEILRTLGGLGFDFVTVDLEGLVSGSLNRTKEEER